LGKEYDEVHFAAVGSAWRAVTDALIALSS
jgi:hypothetical protein